METQQQQLRLLFNAIQHSMDYYDYKNAIFLAERAVAIDSTNQESLFLLAKSHYLDGNKNTCKLYLDSNTSHGPSIVLLGTCCLDLKLYSHGQATLRKWIDLNKSNCSDPSELASAYSCLGRISR